MIGGPPAPPLRSKVSPGKFSGTNGVDHHQLHAAERLGPSSLSPLLSLLPFLSRVKAKKLFECIVVLIFCCSQDKRRRARQWLGARQVGVHGLRDLGEQGRGRERPWTTSTYERHWQGHPCDFHHENHNHKVGSIVSHATYLDLHTQRDRWRYQNRRIFGKGGIIFDPTHL